MTVDIVRTDLYSTRWGGGWGRLLPDIVLKKKTSSRKSKKLSNLYSTYAQPVKLD
jgi:hypothetical protein